MKAKVVLTTLLGIAILALPAAVPASQPGDSGIVERRPVVAAMPPPGHFATLIADPHQAVELAIVMPVGFTTLNWIDQDPFER